MKVDLTGEAGAIFLEALERDGAARDAYVAKACADDDALLSQVRHLLAHHHDEDLVKTPAPPVRALEAAPRRHVDGEWLGAGTLASRLFGGPRSRTSVLVAVIAIVAGLGLWARQEILQKVDDQLRASLTRRLELEKAHVEEWIHGQFLDIQSACVDPELVAIARELAGVGTDLNQPLQVRREQLMTEGRQDALLARLQHILRRDDWEGYALIHRSGVLLAAMDDSFVGQQADPPDADLDQPRFELPRNPENWGAARSRLPAELSELEAMAWVAAPVILGEPKPDGRRPLQVALVLGTPAREFSRIINGTDPNSEAADESSAVTTNESYAVDAQGYLRSATRFSRGYVERLRDRGVEPVWFNESPVDASARNRVPSIKAVDPGRPLGELSGDDVLSSTRLTKILEDVTKHLRPGGRARSDWGVRLEPYRDYRGVSVVGAWAWLSKHGFALIAEVEETEAFAARRYVNLILVLMLALLGVILGVALSSSFAVVRLAKRVEEGTQLGPYTLVERIGEGGLGEVYLARHALLRRPTAIKLLKREVIDEESLGRFEREVQLASQLTSPNTIAVYDFGRTLEGTFYCAMEYLDGMNLAQVVRTSGDLDPSRVVHVLRGACASLGEAHARGLVHRDVKPMNLMLCVQGGYHDVVKLLDFGLVKELGDDHGRQLTQPTRISGTLLYLAPERLRAPDQVDGRTDIYSLGAVAYFLLTGKHHLSGGTDVDLLDRILREEPVPPSQATDQPIPPELERIVLACLSKEMDKRPSDIAQLLSLLDAIPGLERWTEEQAARWWRAHRG